jgi:hypothetical protein
MRRKLYVAENGNGEVLVIEGTRFNHTYKRYSCLEFLDYLNFQRSMGNIIRYPKRGVIVIEEVR